MKGGSSIVGQCRPSVSVLMAVHNGERYLRQAIASVLSADQLVIVDDGSTDRTAQIIVQEAGRAPASWTTPLSKRWRWGLTAALVTGMRLCTGDYIARQDADDLTLPGRFTSQANYLDAHPRCALVASRVQVIDADGKLLRHGCQARWFPALQLRLGRNPIAHGSVTFRREHYDLAGGYRETFQMSQDADLWLRMSRIGSIHILPEELYALREHGGRVSIKSADQQAAWAQAARRARKMG